MQGRMIINPKYVGIHTENSIIKLKYNHYGKLAPTDMLLLYIYFYNLNKELLNNYCVLL